MIKKHTLAQLILLALIGVFIGYFRFMQPLETTNKNHHFDETPRPEVAVNQANPPLPTPGKESSSDEVTADMSKAAEITSSTAGRIKISEERQPILGRRLHTREIRLAEEESGDNHIRDLEFVFRPGILPNRLFQHSRHIISNYDQLYKNEVGQGAMTVRFYFESITTDSNGDGILSDQDKREIGVSYPDGSNYTKLLSGIDQVISHEYLSIENALVLSMKINNQLITQTYSLDNYQLLIDE